MTDGAFFVIAKLPAGTMQPFLVSVAHFQISGLRIVYASEAMPWLDAMLTRWHVAAVHQCMADVEVVFNPVHDPLPTDL